MNNRKGHFGTKVPLWGGGGVCTRPPADILVQKTWIFYPKTGDIKISKKKLESTPIL